MIIWLPYYPNSSSATPQPLTDEGMLELYRVAQTTIEDDTARTVTIKNCSVRTSRRISQISDGPICDLTLTKNGEEIRMNIHRPRRNVQIVFEARPDEPSTEPIN